MIITETRTVEECVHQYKCDIPGCTNVADRMHTCYGCGKHICGYHENYHSYHPITGLDGGDSSWSLCNSCDEKSNAFYDQYRKKMDELDELEDKLLDQWKIKCKEW